MISKVASHKFAAATLAVLIGSSFTLPAFAADTMAPASKAAEQTAPKAKSADAKAKHDAQVAKHKADGAKTGAKVDKTAPVKKTDKTL
jgi:uncharacterized protein (DUF2147 family)